MLKAKSTVDVLSISNFPSSEESNGAWRTHIRLCPVCSRFQTPKDYWELVAISKSQHGSARRSIRFILVTWFEGPGRACATNAQRPFLPSSISASMETSPKLPMDIIGYIADVLGADSHGTNWKSLKMLCLTCKFMVPICRRHLFADISGSLWWRKGFTEFLLSQPIITTHYAKKVSIDLTHEYSASDYNLLQKIHDSSSPITIIICPYHSNWIDSLSDKSWISLSFSLLQLSSLRCLILRSVDKFPAAALSLCSGLQELVLYNGCSWTPLSVDNAVRIPTITTLVITQDNILDDTAYYSLMNLTGQNMVIPFDRLKNLFATGLDCDDFPYVCKLLERAPCLERLELSGEFYALFVQNSSPDIY